MRDSKKTVMIITACLVGAIGLVATGFAGGVYYERKNETVNDTIQPTPSPASQITVTPTPSIEPSATPIPTAAPNSARAGFKKEKVILADTQEQYIEVSFVVANDVVRDALYPDFKGKDFTFKLNGSMEDIALKFSKTATLSGYTQFSNLSRGYYQDSISKQNAWAYTSSLQTSKNCDRPYTSNEFYTPPCGGETSDYKDAKGQEYFFRLTCETESDSGIKACDQIVKTITLFKK
jgi:hypothetical protein